MSEHDNNVQNNSVQFNPGKGFSVSSMILGIVGLVFVWLPPLSLVVSVVGLILGIVGKKKSGAVGAPSGMATAGIVCSIIVLVIWCLVIVSVIVGAVTYLVL